MAAPAVALALVVVLAAPDVASEPPGAAAPFRAAPAIPGRVTMGGARHLGVPEVTFDHWSHRPFFTCRVCHMDLEFAMIAGETAISAQGNDEGKHCGACHDGRTLHGDHPVFRACRGWPRPDAARGCLRCHTGPPPERSAPYEAFKNSMPLDEAGDVDWGAAGRRRQIDPADAVPRVTVRRQTMRIDRDVEILHSPATWMNDVTFSHKRHVGWIACELCHPDVFPIGRRREVGYRMEEMRAGRYCGACHRTVAFPLTTCGRCHPREAR